MQSSYKWHTICSHIVLLSVSLIGPDCGGAGGLGGGAALVVCAQMLFSFSHNPSIAEER